MLIRSRREFLRDAIRSVSAVGALGAWEVRRDECLAAGGSGYQALVCIFLSGGNDGHNTVIPIKTAQQNFSLYQSARGPGVAAVLVAAHQQRQRRLRAASALPEIQGLYNAGVAAVLANVGMLVQPINSAAYNTNNSSIVPNACFRIRIRPASGSRRFRRGLATRAGAAGSPISAAVLECGRNLPRRDFDERIEPFPDRAADVCGQCADGIGDRAELRKRGPSGRDAAVADVR
jgi:hypothetical protein